MKPRAGNASPSTRNLLLGLLAALVLIVVLTAVLARRLLIFSPDDLVFHSETTYTLDEDTSDSLAVFTTNAEVRADVNGHLLVAALESAQLDGDVRESLTIFANTVDFNGDVRGDALFVGTDVQINGDVNGDTVVFAESLTLNTEPTGAVTACVTEVDAPEDVMLRPCDRAAAQTILNRAGTRLAGVWLAARLRGSPNFTDLRPVLPLPPGLLLAGLGALAVVAFPRQVGRMTLAVRTRPRHMAMIGGLVTLLLVGLTAGVLVALSLAALFGLVLLPFYLLALVGFWLLFLGGWAVTSLLVGRWLAARVTDSMIPPVVLAAVGGVALTLAILAVHLVPAVGGILAPLVVFGTGITGLGASYTTRLGLRGVAL